MILILVILLALIGHGYIWVALVNRLHGGAWSRVFVDYVTQFCLFCFLALPVLIVGRWRVEAIGSSALPSLLATPLKSYFYLCVLWGGTKLLLLAWRDRQRDQPDTLLSCHQVPSDLAVGLGSDIFQGNYARSLSLVPGNQALSLCIDHKQLRIPRLHANHEGIRIAHISDLHMTGRLGKRWYEVVVEQVNKLEPDVIAITGDIIENASCLPWLSETVAKLQAQLGVYFVLGNHDYYMDSQATRQVLTDAGLHYLSGSWLETEWRGAPVALAGNELPWQIEAATHPAATPRGEDQLPLRIGLLHTPDQFAWACRHDIDLGLAGHTHGGQIRLPLLGAVASPSLYGTRYACGVFRWDNTVLHVTRGISGKMPIRWNCPPEIAILELVSSAGET